MRTPWRFVADLVSRKPKADHSGAPGSAPKEINALDYNPGDEPDREIDSTPAQKSGGVGPAQEPETQATAPALVPEPATEDTNVSPPEIDTATVIEEATSPSPAIASVETALAATADNAIDVAVKKTVQARNKPSAPAPQASSDVPAVVEAPAAPVGPKTFVEEMAALDLEVAALRRELAKKLRTQNAQLRRMIARFDGR
jgi:hypothetical protein